MENEDFSKDVAEFEELFNDRFSEKDDIYSKLKSKPLSPPTVVYPWKVKRQWFKSWDYGKERQNRDRNRSRYSDHDNNSSNYRDRSQDGESSRYRERHRDDRNDRNWNRDDSRGNSKSNYRRNYHREYD
ncbi:hypothetical protein NPIL_591391 [Nephila pilipes]|uniref:Uncharacterized protein n=1 Tax=Nephila pilipes TaxID=299642 RepID=A0A8X6UQA7_NEPPI|nr:hypothetical protein NPIL_591391 [Nephila pilipes]